MITAKIHNVNDGVSEIFIVTIAEKQKDGEFELLDSRVFSERKQAEEYLSDKDLTKY